MTKILASKRGKTKVEGIIMGTKVVCMSLGAWFSARLGVLAPMLGALGIVMLIDYITGITAACKEGGVSSKVGLWGLVKKLCYVALVALGMVVDWVIITVGTQIGVTLPTTTFFGLLVAVWLIFNEGISILENLGRIGVPYPPFISNAIAILKGKVEETGETVTKKEGEK